MIFLLIVLIACNLFIVASIIWELNKRRRLGRILMKVKLSFINFLPITILSLGGIVIILAIIIYRFNQFDELIEKVLFGAMEFVYIFILIKIFIRTVNFGELREKGITLSRGIIDYSDIRSLNWLNKNKVEIKFAAPMFFKVFKEKWTVKDNEVDELKKLFNEKYYDAY